MVTQTWSCHAWHVACTLSVWLRLSNARSLACHADSHAWCHCRWYFSITQVQFRCGTCGSYVEKPAETQTSIRPASQLVKAHITPDQEDMSLNLLCGPAWCTSWNWKEPWGQVFTVVTSTWSFHYWHVAHYLSCCSWATHSAWLTCLMPLQMILLYNRVKYRHGTGRSYEEMPSKTHTSILLASHLVRPSNSLSEGHEFESPEWTSSVH